MESSNVPNDWKLVMSIGNKAKNNGTELLWQSVLVVPFHVRINTM
jgi:hypothetical protein